METNKQQLTITGYSDDVISFDGSIYDEFNPPYDDNTSIIKLPDGSRIKFYYDSDGIWRGEILEDKQSFGISIQKGDVESDTNDIVTIDHPIRYVTLTCADGSFGILGDYKFSQKTEENFQKIKDMAYEGGDLEGYRAEAVKAILEGIEF